jgi:O-antigen/teichoic acid export membrane protein
MFHYPAIRPLVRYGLYLMGTNILAYGSRSTDNLLIGKFVGSSALGIYSRAYALMLMPMLTVTRVVGHVLFPVLSTIQTDLTRVRGIVLRATGGIALLTFPAVAGVLVSAEPMVWTVLGERWMELVPVLQVLCPVAIWQSFNSILVTVYNALGKTRLQFQVDLVGHAITVSAIAAGLALGGVLGVAYGYLAASFVHFCLHALVTSRMIQLPLWSLLVRLLPTILISVVMSAASWLAGNLAVETGWGRPVQFAFMAVVGVLSYVLLLGTIRPRAYTDLRTAIAKRKNKKVPPP